MFFTISYFPLDNIQNSFFCLFANELLRDRLNKQMDLISRLMIGSTSALTKYEPLRKRKDENVQHPFKQICARNEINPLLFLFSIPLPPPLDQTKQNEDQVLTPACAPRRACLGTCAGHSESSRTMFSPGIFEKKSRKPLD